MYSTTFYCCHDGASFFRPAVAAQHICSHLVFRGGHHRRRGAEKNGAPPSPPLRTGAPHPPASVKMTARPMGGLGGARLCQGECRRAPPSLRRQPPPPRVPAITAPPDHRAWRPAATAAFAGGTHRRRHPATDRAAWASTTRFTGTGVAAGGVRPLAFHATWNPTFNISPNSNITFHVARFLRDSLYASNIRYNGLHLFSGSNGHADRPDPA